MNRHKRERRYTVSKDLKPLFERVIDCYLRSLALKGFPNTFSFTDEPSAEFTPKAYLGGEYRCDVQRATQKALQNRPDLSPALRYLIREQAGLSDHSGQIPSLGNRVDVIQRCGKLFLARSLDPGKYFRRIRKKSKWN